MCERDGDAFFDRRQGIADLIVAGELSTEVTERFRRLRRAQPMCASGRTMRRSVEMLRSIACEIPVVTAARQPNCNGPNCSRRPAGV